MMLGGGDLEIAGAGAGGAQFVGLQSTMTKCGSLETLQLHGAVAGRAPSHEQALYLYSGY